MEDVLLIEKKFTDFEAYADNMLKWNLELIQLSSGKFNGQFRQIILPNIIIQKYAVNKSLKLNGSAPQGYSNFSIYLEGESAPIWRGKELTKDSIAVFPENAELEAISPDGLKTIELAVSNKYLEKVCGYLSLKREDINLAPGMVYQSEKKLLDQLKFLLTKGISNMFTYSSLPVNMNYVYDLELQTVSTLLKLFTAPVSIEDYKQTSKRREALNRIEDVMKKSNLDRMTVADLCEQSDVSIRTLEYAFQEKYNLLPKQYLRTVKLNNVHKFLVKSSPEEVKISDIANECGFWHMGQFAKDYKNLFGELPSETLHK